MSAQGAALPPSVRVPTLDPSRSLFTGTHLFRNNLHYQHAQGTTLSDHYQLMHDSVAATKDCCINSPEKVMESSNTVRINDLICGIYESSAAAMGELADASPPSLSMTPSSQQTPSNVFRQRSASLQRTHAERRPSLSARGTRRDESPARPAWNQNRPTPRSKPTVSDPRTEPRRVAHESSIENRSRPWLEGLKRTNSSRNRLSTGKNSSNGSNTAMPASENLSRVPVSVRKTSLSGSTIPNKAFVCGTKGTVKREEEDGSSVCLRLDFLEKSLQDAQVRATRAEARCEDLEVSLHSLTLQHREVTSRLEERNIQLSAQVQYAMQWIQSFEAAGMAREPCSQVVDAETEVGGRIPEASLSPSKSEDITRSSHVLSGPKSAGETQCEVAVKGTAVRVPPAPPMTLRFQ